VKRYFALGYCPQNIICQKKKIKKENKTKKQTKRERSRYFYMIFFWFLKMGDNE